MPHHVSLLSAEDPLWPACLRSCRHDIYHQPGYAVAVADSELGTAAAVHSASVDGAVLVPFIRRELGGGLWDALSPYGYAGPVRTDATSIGAVAMLLSDAHAAMAEQGCVSFFQRWHPWLNDQWPVIDEVAGATFQTSSPSVAIDLRQPAEAIRAGFASGHRNEINRSLRGGYEVLHDSSLQFLLSFAALYRQDMGNIGARAYYLFDDAYFARLFADPALGASLRVVLLEGMLVGGAIFFKGREWVNYHLSAADHKHRRASPAKLLIDDACLWAKQSGRLWLHLGGGRGGGQDSLLRFKAGFSNIRRDCRTVGLVLRPQDYAELSRAAVGSSFFPIYRAPKPLMELM